MKKYFLFMMVFLACVGGPSADALGQGQVGVYENNKSSGTSTHQEKSNYIERGASRGKSKTQSSTQSRRFTVDQEVSAIPLIIEAIRDFEQYLPGSLRAGTLLSYVSYHGLLTRRSPVFWGAYGTREQREWFFVNVVNRNVSNYQISQAKGGLLRSVIGRRTPDDDADILRKYEEINKHLVYPYIYYAELIARSVELLEDAANRMGAAAIYGAPVVNSVSQAKDVAIGAVILAAKDTETQNRINGRKAELAAKVPWLSGKVDLKLSPGSKVIPININFQTVGGAVEFTDNTYKPLTIQVGPLLVIPETNEVSYYGKPYFNTEGAMGRTAKIIIPGRRMCRLPRLRSNDCRKPKASGAGSAPVPRLVPRSPTGQRRRCNQELNNEEKGPCAPGVNPVFVVCRRLGRVHPGLFLSRRRLHRCHCAADKPCPTRNSHPGLFVYQQAHCPGPDGGAAARCRDHCLNGQVKRDS